MKELNQKSIPLFSYVSNSEWSWAWLDYSLQERETSSKWGWCEVMAAQFTVVFGCLICSFQQIANYERWWPDWPVPFRWMEWQLDILRVIGEDNSVLKSHTLTHDGVIYIQLAEEETGEAMYLLLLRVNMPVILVSAPLGSGPGLPGLSAQGCEVPFHQRVMAMLTAL